MKVLKYGEWKDTATTVHMILQMMGKTKLNKMNPQPEWNQSLLYINSEGFTTGLINNNNNSFEIKLNLHKGSVEATCTSGLSASFMLRDNTSISEYYSDYLKILETINHNVTIYPVPQEVHFTTPFPELVEKTNYDNKAALDYFKSCIFVRNALLKFASEYRGKKILPAMFWGTFDMTTVLFSGKEIPFPGEGIIEKVAFNEQFVEFGYWPGDPYVEDPSLFILAYPFIEKDLAHLPIEPKEAYYLQEKAEYFLSLKDVFKYDNPEEVIVKFCEQAFINITNEEKWDNKDWLLEPFNIKEFK